MKSTGPLVVQGPWLDSQLHVEALYSGGDHCFATVTGKVNVSLFFKHAVYIFYI